MGLHDRINGPVLVTQDAAADTTTLSSREAQSEDGRGRRQDPYAELKTRVHHACIAQLGPELFAAESPQDLEERVMRTVMEQLALDRTPLTREERQAISRRRHVIVAICSIVVLVATVLALLARRG